MFSPVIGVYVEEASGHYKHPNCQIDGVEDVVEYE